MKIGIWGECDYDECDLVVRLVEDFSSVFLAAVNSAGEPLSRGYILALSERTCALELCFSCNAPVLRRDNVGSVIVRGLVRGEERELNPREEK